MRISDWSSDVCSSDLSDARRRGRAALRLPGAGAYPMVVDAMAGRRARGVGGADRRGLPDRALPRQSDAPDALDGQPRPRQIRADRRIGARADVGARSEEHTSELQSLMRISYA